MVSGKVSLHLPHQVVRVVKLILLIVSSVGQASLFENKANRVREHMVPSIGSRLKYNLVG